MNRNEAAAKIFKKNLSKSFDKTFATVASVGNVTYILDGR